VKFFLKLFVLVLCLLSGVARGQANPLLFYADSPYDCPANQQMRDCMS